MLANGDPLSSSARPLGPPAGPAVLARAVSIQESARNCFQLERELSSLSEPTQLRASSDPLLVITGGSPAAAAGDEGEDEDEAERGMRHARLQMLADYLHEWEFDIFALANATTQPLVFAGFVMLDSFSGRVKLHKESMLNFLKDAEASYWNVPYHNSLHGASVGRLMFSFLVEGGLQNKLAVQDQFCLVLAGLMHDVGHPGLTSTFILKERRRRSKGLASQYNDQSPLENMHLAATFQLLKKKENNFINDSLEESIRPRLIAAVLATDMAQHAEHLTRLDMLIENLADGGSSSMPWYWPKLPPAHLSEEKRKDIIRDMTTEFIMCTFLHAADIATPTIPYAQFRKWNDLVQQEFEEQGELEVKEFGKMFSPAAGFDRKASDKSRHAFTRFFLVGLVKPLFEKMHELTLIEAEVSVASGVDVSRQLSRICENIVKYDEEKPVDD